jgi:hypothetical protein
MLHRAAFVRTDILEAQSASIIRVTRICELGMLSVTTNRIARTHTDDGILHYSCSSSVTLCTSQTDSNSYQINPSHKIVLPGVQQFVNSLY